MKLVMVLMVSLFSGEAWSASCFCKAVAYKHSTVNPPDFHPISNIDGLDTFTLNLGEGTCTQISDVAASNIGTGTEGSCRKKCRNAAGIDGATQSSAMTSAKATMMANITSWSQPDVSCGGWVSADYSYACGTNQYNGASGAIGVGSFRVCNSLKPWISKYSNGTVNGPGPYVTTVTSPLVPIVPTIGSGIAKSYSIAPALPAGLSIHATTGVISGTASVAAPLATYVVTVSNNNGTNTSTSTYSIQIQVNPRIKSSGTTLVEPVPSTGF